MMMKMKRNSLCRRLLAADRCAGQECPGSFSRKRLRTYNSAASSLLQVTLIGFISCLSLPLHAQEQPQPFSESPFQFRINPPSGLGDPDVVYQPEDEAAVPEDPYWRETVERAIKQFESKNPDLRRSAVMLLGKYPVRPAQEVVGKALEDSDAGVRQAALVSVLEEPGQMGSEFTDKLVRLLGDPDVSIRRITSNSIPMILNSFPFILQAGAGQMQRQLPDDAAKILRDAFRDEDVSVRRNMVNSYPMLRVNLPEETVVSLLRDPDTEVAVHSLRWGLPLLNPATLSREIENLVRHENPVFRLELARALQFRLSPEALDALEILQEDPHPPVALEAMLAIFNHRQFVGLYERMVKLYRESGAGSDAGQRLIFAAQMLGDQGEPFLREWLKDSNPAHRQQAAQVYLNRFAKQAEMDFLLSLLDDSVQGVRQQAMRALMQSHERLTLEHVRQTLSSRYVDVRRATAGLAAFLPPDQAEDILLDLLLDGVRDVQVAALQQIGQRQIDGWEEIMGISLRVEDPIVSRNALEWLMRHPTPHTLDLIRAYRDENPQSTMRPQIEIHLKRYQLRNPS